MGVLDNAYANYKNIKNNKSYKGVLVKNMLNVGVDCDFIEGDIIQDDNGKLYKIVSLESMMNGWIKIKEYKVIAEKR